MAPILEQSSSREVLGGPSAGLGSSPCWFEGALDQSHNIKLRKGYGMDTAGYISGMF